VRINLLQMARDTDRQNETIRRTNRYLRYNSPEENEFKMGAFIGMLFCWNTFDKKILLQIGSNKLFFTTKYVKTPLPQPQYLPGDLSKLISTFSTRKDASALAQTCHAANQSANKSAGHYVAKHGTSYKETPCEPNPYWSLIW
jgi:hypothetical protein